MSRSKRNIILPHTGVVLEGAHEGSALACS